jgi:hypothetical protein
MSAVALVTGNLFKRAERKTSKNGNEFVTATIKAKDGDGAQFWRLTAFATDAAAELMRLSPGDAVAAQGKFSAELYHPEGGEPRVSLSMVVDQALAARPKPRQYSPKSKPVPSFAAPNQTALLRTAGGQTVDGLNDELPW